MLYRPDPFIATKLREIEETLSLRWNQSRQVWEVWDSKPAVVPCGTIDEGRGRLGSVQAIPYRVLSWKGPKGEFMSLDYRLVVKMRMLKAIRDGGLKKLVKEIDEHNSTVREMKEQGLLEDLTYMIREDKRYWKKWMGEDLGITSERSPESMSRVFV